MEVMVVGNAVLPRHKVMRVPNLNENERTSLRHDL
jgi:hypothetical protein